MGNDITCCLIEKIRNRNVARKSVSKAKKKIVSARKMTSKKSLKKTVKKVAVKRKKKVLAIPKGYHAVTPYLIVNGGIRAIEFYKKAFGAKATVCMKHDDGKIGHAELKIGDSYVMLGDGCPEMKAFSPEHFGGSPVSIHLYVKNVDLTVKRAVAAGAKLIMPVEDMFYGDRSGAVKDPFGHSWYIATHIEDLTKAEIRKRAIALYGK